MLGNHDFYGGSIEAVRAAVTALERPAAISEISHGDRKSSSLTPKVGLIGDDGWADARLGNYEQSLIMMNDYRLIAELAPLSKEDRWPKLQELGDQAAAHVRRLLPQALAAISGSFSPRTSRPCARPAGTKGNFPTTNGCPISLAKPSAIRFWKSCATNPTKQLTVYCGHTHSPGICQPLSNVTIHTGLGKLWLAGDPADH